MQKPLDFRKFFVGLAQKLAAKMLSTLTASCKLSYSTFESQ